MTPSIHPFLFQSGTWLGQGIITFSLSSEEITYYTKWIVEEMTNNQIQVTQQVEIPSVEEPVISSYLFYEIGEKSFKVRVDSATYGKNEGKGIYNSNHIAWEFHGEGLPFEGLEIFRLQENNTYLSKAEFVSEENLRTIIEGKLWEKQEKEQPNETK